MAVAKLALKQIVAESDIIVLAQVRAVSIEKATPSSHPLEISRENEQHAVARVSETWKGNPSETIKFLASPTWTCDITGAVVGEETVLFLRLRSPELFEVVLAGRGKMPLRTVDGLQYVSLWDQVIMPAEVPMIDGPSPHSKHIRSVKLDILRELVRNIGERL